MAVQVLKEARRYQTFDTAASWPLVYNTSSDIADYYTSLKVRRMPAAGAVVFFIRASVCCFYEVQYIRPFV